MCGNVTCVAICYVTLWQSAHGSCQQVCIRCISQLPQFIHIWPPPHFSHYASFPTIFLRRLFPIIGCHLSQFPPDPISCFILLLSNYLYLTRLLWTTWLSVKEKDGCGMISYGRLQTLCSNTAPLDQEKICRCELAQGGVQCAAELCLLSGNQLIISCYSLTCLGF